MKLHGISPKGAAYLAALHAVAGLSDADKVRVLRAIAAFYEVDLGKKPRAKRRSKR